MKFNTVLAFGIATGYMVAAEPVASDCHEVDVTYRGAYANEAEGFLGIRFAQNTGGENRFKPPRPYTPPAGSAIDASVPGPACPQKVSNGGVSISFSDVTEISEDCLRLNVWRPNGTKAGDRLPVLAYIYGGGFTSGSKDDIISQPGGLILQSIANGHPVIAVELNYRLGVFGFAQSAALEKEGSENAGLRDQRLALEWLHDDIAAFGGDPSRITIHGQSSGGLAVGMQTMAFGASKPLPFQQAICESQALEPGITGNFTRKAMAAVWEATDCNSTDLDSETTVECLRNLPMHKLLHAQIDTTTNANVGDIWLPVVDGEGGFLPAAPSTLIRERRFGNITTIMGWCEDDATLFTPPTIQTPNDTLTFITEYLPSMSSAHVHELLSLYPTPEFRASHFPNGTTILSAEFYRCARILRDVLFTCQPILYSSALAAAGNDVYLYDQNQTVTTPIWHAFGLYGLGVTHGSELPYVFGNWSKFEIPGVTAHPSPQELKLKDRESRSWSTFAALGKPSLEGHETLPGWRRAEFGEEDEDYGVYVIGGPTGGYSGTEEGDSKARTAMKEEKLGTRCEFLNRPDIVKEIQY